MRVPVVRVGPALQKVREHRWVVAAVLVALAAVIGLSWLVSLATAPARHSGRLVGLDAYGIPGVELQIIHPTRVGVRGQGDAPATITVLARALSEASARPLQLVLPLSDASIAFVDRSGTHVPGRLEVVPGHPDAMPHDLHVVHEDTQVRGTLLRPYRVDILPLVRADDEAVAVPELAFSIRLESYWEQVVRGSTDSVARVGTPYLALGLVTVAVVWVWLRVSRQQRLAREKRLSPVYSRLREHIRLERWEDARQEIEGIQLLEPHYRDVDQLDALVSAAESAAWRREQLYSMGVAAYKRRDWPSAVQAFSAIEREAAYYGDSRFLKRTAALYADLGSRDRGRRVAAAKELGQVADLIDMTPLLSALGDPSSEVADAAEEAFRCIGIETFDVLLAGLVDSSKDVRRRAYHLIEGYGQAVRGRLLAALRSSDPRITRPVARLLVSLGARQELAEALLHLPPAHQEGVVEALQGEGMAASGVLINVLLEASPERQQVVINALAAVKTKADIDRRIVDALRAAKDPVRKDLLQRALRTPAAPFRVAGDAPAIMPLPAGKRSRHRSGKLSDRRSS